MDKIREMLTESFYNENGRLPTAEELERLYLEFESDIQKSNKEIAS